LCGVSIREAETAGSEPDHITMPPELTRVRLEYQPGVYLTLVGADACGGEPRPAMLAIDQALADAFARRGYVGVYVEARNPGHSGQFDAETVRAVASVVHDLAIAVQWLRAHADEHCVEPDGIAATGHSFGALAALALAYSEGEGPVGTITIDEYGTTVTVEPSEFGPVPSELVPYSNDPDGVVAFSGFALPSHIDSGEPPAIIFHGRNDDIIPFSLAEETCAAAEAVGVTCELVAHNAGHSFPPDLAGALDRAVQFLDREFVSPEGASGRSRRGWHPEG
jgi:predicted esterase